MSLGSEVATFLASNGIGVLGTSMFLGKLPETPDTAIGLFETGGAPPQSGFGVSGIQHERPSLQLRFRGAPRDTEGPRARAQTAYRLLMTVQGQTLSGTLYLWLRPAQSPFVLERDGNDRTVWTFNVNAEKELSA